MVKVFEGTPEEYYMDGYLKRELDNCKLNIVDDWDYVFIIDGKVRSGKSVLAQQIAKYVYPKFSLKDVVFTPQQFMDAVRTSEPYQCIVYDEGYGGLSSAKALSRDTQILKQMFTEIGCRNLYIIIVLPCFFDLLKYVSLDRSNVLINVYTHKKKHTIGSDNEDFFKKDRGYFKVYDEDRKLQLFQNPITKQYHNYSAQNPNFYGRFTKHWVIDEKDYDDKKKKASDDNVLNNKKHISTPELNELIAHRVAMKSLRRGDIPSNEVLDLIGISRTAYNRWVALFNNNPSYETKVINT